VPRVAFQLEIARPREEVFAFLTDVDRVRDWQPATEEVRRETEGPTAVGTSYVQVLRLLGKRIESRIEVTALEPPSRLSISSTGGPVDFSVTHLLDASPTGTRLAVDGEGTARGVFKLGEGAAVKAGERELRKSFERLKALLESGR
jgi:carbon monoxide dehydrogenase subunit G